MANANPEQNRMPALESVPTTKEVIVINHPIDKPLVVLSGGQDSTTCLHWALRKFGHGNVEAISFDYGQRHAIELESAKMVAGLAGVPHTVLPINTFTALGGSALVGSGDVNDRDATNPTLPASFVPGRNLIFFGVAAAFAYQRGIHDLVCGVGQADSSGYPDCRESTLDALERAICLGMDYEIHIHAPLMHLNKAETVQLTLNLGSAAMEALAFSHTCYNGNYPPCGACPACILRARGFEEAGIEDPLIVRARREGLL